MNGNVFGGKTIVIPNKPFAVIFDLFMRTILIDLYTYLSLEMHLRETITVPSSYDQPKGSFVGRHFYYTKTYGTFVFSISNSQQVKWTYK